MTVVVVLPVPNSNTLTFQLNMPWVSKTGNNNILWWLMNPFTTEHAAENKNFLLHPCTPFDILEPLTS